MVRNIVFAAKQRLGYHVMRGIGLREAILIGAAALFAVYIIFMATSLALELRLTLALVVSVALLTVAKVPIQGYRMEEMFLIWLRGQIRPKRAVHQTGRRTMPVFEGDADVRDGQDVTTPQVAVRPATTVAHAGGLVWAEPDWGTVMALFVGLLIVGSALAYAAGTGVLPKLNW
jgi:cell division protein FtsW (lipid II flippase)